MFNAFTIVCLVMASVFILGTLIHWIVSAKREKNWFHYAVGSTLLFAWLLSIAALTTAAVNS